jgi:WhiB family transcriptional regulator, redox-sensing transcriptional regulator
MPIIHGPDVAKPLALACAGTPIDVFFRSDGESEADWLARQPLALAICKTCPIRRQCLEDALKFPAAEQHGVQGGETAERRRAIIASRRQAARRAERRAAA